VCAGERKKLEYDHLATCDRLPNNRALSIPAKHLEGVFGIQNRCARSDALAPRAKASQEMLVAVIGCGVIGLEFAADSCPRRKPVGVS